MNFRIQPKPLFWLITRCNLFHVFGRVALGYDASPSIDRRMRRALSHFVKIRLWKISGKVAWRVTSLIDAKKLHHSVLARKLGVGALRPKCHNNQTVMKLSDQKIRPANDVIFESTKSPFFLPYFVFLFQGAKQRNRSDLSNMGIHARSGTRIEGRSVRNQIECKSVPR